MKKRQTLTVAELEIMQVVWQLGRCTVRDVYRTLLDRKEVAYTTVMTMMNVLEEKSHLLKISKEGRAYIYKPSRPQNQVISNMLDDFLTRVFGGSAQRLVLSLVKGRKLSEEDLRSISQMIKKAEAE